MAKGSKRIRKKKLKRMLCKLIAAYYEYEAARERAFYKAIQMVEDTCTDPREAIQCYMRIAAIMASTGPVPRSIREKYNKASVSE